MQRSSHVRRRFIVYIALGIAIFLLVWTLRIALRQQMLPINDFGAFWGATRLAFQQHNPYDAEALLSLQMRLGWDKDFPLLVWNPPWLFVLLSPFAFLPFVAAQLIWVLVIALVLVSITVLWLRVAKYEQNLLVPAILVFFFPPTLMLLKQQQLTGFVLLGVTLFVVFVRRKRWKEAGSALLFLSLKPHLILPFAFLVMLWVLQKRRWGILLWGGVTASIVTLASCSIYPSVWNDYMTSALSAPPVYWRTPTFTTWLREIGGPERAWLLWVFPALSLLIAFVWWQRTTPWRWEEHTPLVLGLGVLGAPYAWLADQVLLLPMLLYAISYVRVLPPLQQRWWIGGYVLWCVLYGTLLNVFQEPLLMTWFAPVFFAGYLALPRFAKHHSPSQS